MRTYIVIFGHVCFVLLNFVASYLTTISITAAAKHMIFIYGTTERCFILT
jgi:hypothetical protein